MNLILINPKDAFIWRRYFSCDIDAAELADRLWLQRLCRGEVKVNKETVKTILKKVV